MKRTGAVLSVDMPDSEKPGFWQDHIGLWRKSGLSQAAYCREQGLRVNRFSYWKRRLESGGKTSGLEASLVRVPVLAGSGLLEDSTSGATSAVLEVRIGERYRISVGAGFVAAHLQALVRALEGI